ncbi:titin isoform X2, partial [Biomphalaria glabrata]
VPLRMTLTLKKVIDQREVLAKFTCMLSKTDLRVAWFKDEDKILASEKHELVDEGRLHKLIVHELCAEDYGDYLVVIGSRRMTGLSLRE